MTIFGLTGEPNPISESTPEDGASDELRQPKKGPPLYVIPLTLSIGLVVAATYIGNRVLASKSHAVRSTESVSATLKPPAPAVASPVGNDKVQTSVADTTPLKSERAVDSKIAPPRESAPPSSQAAAPPVTGDPSDAMIVPRPGERYLQLAAIPTQTAPKFLSKLRGDNLQASVAAGPSEGLVRVLVGPFSDRDSLDRAKAQLDVLKLDCFVRVY
jgi:cell division septation protein DedD